MQYHFIYREVKPSAFLEEYAKNKLNNCVGKFMHKATRCHVSFTRSGLETEGKVHLTGRKHHQFIVHANTSDAYSVIDLVADRLRRQIVRYCETVKRHHNSYFKHHNAILNYIPALT